MKNRTQPGPRSSFPTIRQPGRQPRVLRLAWAGVTLALWLAYGAMAAPLLGTLLWEDPDLLAWVRRHRIDVALLWAICVAAAGASLLLVAWAELDGLRRRRRPLPRPPDARAAAIARRLHASKALHGQLAHAKIMRLRLDEHARPVSAECQPTMPGRRRGKAQTGARVCPSPRTTKRSTVSASRPIGP